MKGLDSNIALQSIYNHPLFTQEQLDKIFAAHTKFELSKNEYLLRQGQTAKSYYIIEWGLVRFYVIDYNGNEITLNLSAKMRLLMRYLLYFSKPQVWSTFRQ